MQGIHIVIPISLRQDRGRCNGKVFTIPLHYGGMRQILVFLETITVYQQMFRTHLQLVDSPMHGQERSIQDIDLVNLLGSNDAHRPSHCLTFNDFPKLVTLTLCQLFGIIQQFIMEVRRENDRCCIDRTSQTSTSSLIASCFN